MYKQWRECYNWVQEKMVGTSMKERMELMAEYYKTNKKIYHEN